MSRIFIITVAVALSSCWFFQVAAVAQDDEVDPRAYQPAPGKAHPAAPQPSNAQPPSIEQFVKIRVPSAPTVAPNGALYVRDWPDGVNQLYRRSDAKNLDEPMQRLTDFEDGLSSYAMSPDGRWIILSAATGGSEQNDLYLLDPTTDEITPLFVDPAVVYGFQTWLRDSSGFIYTANDDSAADFHVYHYDFASKQPRKILDEPGYWMCSDVSADAGRALLTQYRSVSDSSAYELNIADSTLTELNLGESPTYNEAMVYLPGDATALISSDVEQGIERLFAIDLGSMSHTKPLPSIDAHPVEGVVVSDDRQSLAVLYNEGGYRSMKLVSLPEFEAMPMPSIDKGLIGSVDLHNGMLTWAVSNVRNPGVAYLWELGDDARPTQITRAHDQGIDLGAFPLPDLVEYESFDGRKIPAFVFTPPMYHQGTRIPFVVMFHGGPEGQHRPSFHALTQYLLSRGYGVMKPNVRGSMGYGREFHQLDNYTKRWDSVRDGVEAARWLVSNGYSKPGWMATYGGSYGGFMSVATLIEGADVFGAGINVVGIVNFQTFLEQTKSYRRKLREVEYGPLSDPEFLQSVSPINRIDEIKVPMMIAHGLNDPRVPVGEAMQLAVGLQQRGYDPELLFFPDEGHGFVKLENRLLFADRMDKFLREHIGNRRKR